MNTKGIDRNIKRIKNLSKEIEKGVLETIKNETIDMSFKSIKECPLDTGELRDSYKVELNNKVFITGKDTGVDVKDVRKTFDKGKVRIVASYNTDYAAYVHEGVEMNFRTPGTKAKFLADPFERMKFKIKDNIEETIDEIIDE